MRRRSFVSLEYCLKDTKSGGDSEDNEESSTNDTNDLFGKVLGQSSTT